MASHLSSEGQATIDYIESNPASIANVETEKQRYQQLAQLQLAEKETVSIELLTTDMERIKAQSFSQGLSYQALISAIIHQYANGKIRLES
jgi:predicted DNA binding CopG/RHH family protein